MGWVGVERGWAWPSGCWEQQDLRADALTGLAGLAEHAACAERRRRLHSASQAVGTSSARIHAVPALPARRRLQTAGSPSSQLPAWCPSASSPRPPLAHRTCTNAAPRLRALWGTSRPPPTPCGTCSVCGSCSAGIASTAQQRRLLRRRQRQGRPHLHQGGLPHCRGASSSSRGSRRAAPCRHWW